MGITKCKNNKCPLAHKCYRYMSKPNPIMQLSQAFEPLTVGNATECDYFMPNREIYERR